MCQNHDGCYPSCARTMMAMWRPKKVGYQLLYTGPPSGVPTGDPSGADDGYGYSPPCRQAEGFIAPCPRCGREMRLKTLRYSHVCGKSFDPTQRARELQAAAETAINAKIALMEQPMERTQQTMDQKNKYSNLINF